MGGPGSGRRSKHWTTEACLALDMDDLRRERHIRPGVRLAGWLRWRETDTGRVVRSQWYRTEWSGDTGALYLSRTSPGLSPKVEDRIQLVSLPQPFGGRRWWFLCPRTGRRSTRLYLPYGGQLFASRQAYGLTYPSQRESERYRALRRAFRLRLQLKSDGAIGDPILKPKWMRRATYDRQLARIARAERILERHTTYLMALVACAEKQHRPRARKGCRRKLVFDKG